MKKSDAYQYFFLPCIYLLAAERPDSQIVLNAEKSSILTTDDIDIFESFSSTKFKRVLKPGTRAAHLTWLKT
jgi:hypothetical protein